MEHGPISMNSSVGLQQTMSSTPPANCDMLIEEEQCEEKVKDLGRRKILNWLALFKTSLKYNLHATKCSKFRNLWNPPQTSFRKLSSSQIVLSYLFAVNPQATMKLLSVSGDSWRVWGKFSYKLNCRICCLLCLYSFN